MRLNTVVSGIIVCASAPSVVLAQEQATPVAAAADSATPLTPVTVRAKKARPNRDALTREELAAKPSATLFDIVMTQRSQWMRGPATARSSLGVTSTGRGGSAGGRGTVGDDQPSTRVTAGALAGTVVYLDGRNIGPLTLLRTMPVETAEKLCYYTMNQAQGRYGMAVNTPVVAVFSRGSRMADDAC